MDPGGGPVLGEVTAVGSCWQMTGWCTHARRGCMLGNFSCVNFKKMNPPSQNLILIACKKTHPCSIEKSWNLSSCFSEIPGYCYIWMWELDYKEGWVPKNWCFWTVLLKTLESSLDCKEIKPVNPKGNQPWRFIERTDAEAPILCPPDAKSWLIGKGPNAGKDWGQEKGVTEDGWHHRLNGHWFEQPLGNSEGQGSLVCCSPWGCKETWLSDWITVEEGSTSEWLYLFTQGWGKGWRARWDHFPMDLLPTPVGLSHQLRLIHFFLLFVIWNEMKWS